MSTGYRGGTPLASPSPGGGVRLPNDPLHAPAHAYARETEPTPAVGEGLADTLMGSEESAGVGGMPEPEFAQVSASTRGRAAIAAVPVILVNAVAFAGQLAFLREHLPWPLLGQVMMAVALESIAIYLAFHAHLAQLANDSALGKRLAAYAFALLIAGLNYSHYAGPHWQPTFAAVAVALCSAISPWLWGIHSRRVSRDALLASGLIEPHALRLGQTRWIWHPLRSAKVMWLATWEGIAEPRDAVTRWEATVRKGGTKGVTRSAALTAGARQARPQIEASAHASSGAAADASGQPQVTRQPVRRKAADGRVRVTRLLTQHPDMPRAEVARRADVSESTVDRVKRDLPTRLRVAGE